MTTLTVADLVDGEVEIRGRIMPASNSTYLVDVVTEGAEPVPAVYKPVSGERPLWDFPHGTLADRELAAFCVSETLGWRVVPPTIVRDGPMGPGMVQRWCTLEEEPGDKAVRPASGGIDPVDLVPEGPVPPGFRHVLEATDGYDRPVQLVHDDSSALHRMAVFDIVTNNTDRKGGHILPMPDGHRYGVDHGICFHVDDKLRTVLWGFAGEPLTDEERDGLERLTVELSGGQLDERLSDLLTRDEVDRTRMRVSRLLRQGHLPVPRGGWPSIPWPPF